jgi:prepilin-type N-terminal cleavage/methylation domain-containing protein
MKKRKGFTLIELMIVIAIIIILAAIAIPNYLRMTDRARRSRVAGDFTSIATALEAYSVDWGAYPIETPEEFGKNIDGTTMTSQIGLELSGLGTAAPEINILSGTTLTGEAGGIDYIKAETIQAMYNPFDPTHGYWYVSSPSGNHWVLEVQYTTGSNAEVLWRSDASTDLTQIAATAGATLAVGDDGTVTP